jgi:hypothetical protein
VFVDLIRQADRDRADGIPPHKAVNAIRIKSTESPHAELDSSPFGMADRTWLEAMARRYGKDSLWYRSHVLAEIPTVAADVLIPSAWLDWAASRPQRLALPANHPIHRTRRIACDLGEGVGRDSSAIVVRDDWGVLEVVYGSTLGLAEAADRIAGLRTKYSVPDERISFDAVGIGRDFPLHLKRRGISRATPYAGAAKPRAPQFKNLRTEAAWRLRQRLDPEGADDHREPGKHRPDFSIPPGDYWPRLREELAALTYDLAKHQTRLLAKDDWKTVLGHSPDLADALLQSFAFD